MEKITRGVVMGCVSFFLSFLTICIIVSMIQGSSLPMPKIDILVRRTYLGMGLCSLIGGAVTGWIVQNKGLKYGCITGVLLSIIFVFIELGWLIENFVSTLPFLVWCIWLPILCCASIGGCFGEYYYKLKEEKKNEKRDFIP